MKDIMRNVHVKYGYSHSKTKPQNKKIKKISLATNVFKI